MACITVFFGKFALKKMNIIFGMATVAKGSLAKISCLIFANNHFCSLIFMTFDTLEAGNIAAAAGNQPAVESRAVVTTQPRVREQQLRPASCDAAGDELAGVSVVVGNQAI